MMTAFRRRLVTIRLAAFAGVLALMLAGCAGSTTPSEAMATTMSTPSGLPSPTSAPPLTQTFTSTLHRISLSYPEGWTAQPATESWTGAPFNFGDPSADILHDPVLEDHLFLSMASQPIGDTTPDEWVAEHLFECTGSEPAAVDGATGLIGAGDCNMVAVTTDSRGYIFLLYTSGDEAWLSSTYNRAWFEEVLATVQLHPEDAVD
jgi:hypothetical protein